MLANMRLLGRCFLRCCSATIIARIWLRRATRSLNWRVASSGSRRTLGFVASMKWAMTAASIGSVLARLPSAFGEGANLGGIDDDDRQASRQQARGDHRFVAASRFKAHNRDLKLAKPLPQRLEPRLVPRDDEPFAPRANRHVQLVLGDIERGGGRRAGVAQG
jgi:hypothetical protein